RRRLARLAGRITPPSLPKAVEIAVMGKEDRITARGLEHGHVAGDGPAIRPPDAADIDMDRAMRGVFERIVVVGIVRVRSRDSAEAERDIVGGRGLEKGRPQGGPAGGAGLRIVLEKPSLAVAQPRRLRAGKPNRLGERAAGLAVSVRDAPIAAPIPVRIGEGIVARELTDLAF